MGSFSAGGVSLPLNAAHKNAMPVCTANSQKSLKGDEVGGKHTAETLKHLAQDI